MLTEERQQKILEILEKQSSIKISELEKHFKVSNETLRRDLLALEAQKKLLRVHGGVISNTGVFTQKNFSKRHTENIEFKKELSLHAINFINEGDIIAVDSGSTAAIFCEVLTKHFKNLTVVMTSLKNLSILSKNDGFRLVLCAGELDRETETFSGMLTTESIRRLHISKAFVFPAAISLKHGLTEFDAPSIEVQKAMLEVSEKCFVLADHSKFEIGVLYKAFDLTSDMTVITDHALNDDLYTHYINAGIDIIRSTD